MVTKTYNDCKIKNNKNYFNYRCLPHCSLYIIFEQLDLHRRNDYFLINVIRNNELSKKYNLTKW